MAIRCHASDCKFNKNRWCDLYYLEIDEKRRCLEYEPKDELKSTSS